ncbi:MAG TPA: type II CAAX endopeptidase family protein [Solirubrobacteraceae bacterium]|nr:type II CAAX endopeptidase family protein [Solirubrobacteraceae bacterium]
MRYAFLAYVVSWVAANVLLLLLSIFLPLHVGVEALVVDAMLLAALVPLRSSGRLAMPGDLGLRRVPAARSVGYALLAFAIVAVSDIYWSKIVPHNYKASAANPFVAVSSQSALNIALAAFAAAVSAPVVEEVFFRGLVYRSLRNRLPVLLAALVAGLMFGLVHAGAYPLVTLPSKAFFGIVMCLLYERTGSLLPGIAIHSFVNAGGFEITLTKADGIVATVFLLLATVLLATPPVKGFWRLVKGRFTGLPVPRRPSSHEKATVDA